MSITLEVVPSAIAVQAGLSEWYDAPVASVISYVRASVLSAQASGSPITIDLRKNGASILATPLVIANGALGSQVELIGVNAAEMDRLCAIVLGIGDGTAMGLKVTFGNDLPAGGSDIPTATAPPVAPPPSTPVLTLIDRTTGTHFGNMTVFGLGNAFDGVTNAAGAQCAAVSASPGYLGTTWQQGKVFGGATLFGGNDRGFASNSTGPVTITAYGRNTPPTALNDLGTPLGSLTFNNTLNESAGRQIAPNGNTSAWTSIWYVINGGGTFSTYCAEVVEYEVGG